MARVEDMIIGQPKIKDYTIVFQIECPDCKTNFQMVSLIGASARCTGESCPCAFVVNGPAKINPNLATGQIEMDLPLQMVRIGLDGRPIA